MKELLQPGLVSVTFRQMMPEAIVQLAARAGLRGIEWGGDIHAPPGDVLRARHVRRLTQEAGLEVASYGSYLRLGERVGAPISQRFAPVLDVACELGAPSIRVWAGNKASREATPDDWQHVVDDALAIAQSAGEWGLDVAFEYHGGTLTDSPESARRLLESAVHPHLHALWQPGGEVETRPDALRHVLPRLLNLHVFHWDETGRRPLSEGAAQWTKYLQVAAQTRRRHWALLEFVRDDAPNALLQDARTLLAWCAENHAAYSPLEPSASQQK